MGGGPRVGDGGEWEGLSPQRGFGAPPAQLLCPRSPPALPAEGAGAAGPGRGPGGCGGPGAPPGVSAVGVKLVQRG